MNGEITKPGYYIRETGCWPWVYTKAKTLKGAQKAAERARIFKGTNLYVGFSKYGGRGSFDVVSENIQLDLLDMADVGTWEPSKGIAGGAPA